MNRCRYIFSFFLLLGVSVLFSSCDDFLDRTPEVTPAPEDYFSNASQLRAYVDNYYERILPSHGNASGTTGWDYGLFGNDRDTDNQASGSPSNKFLSGKWTVEGSNGNWTFGSIMSMNLFFEQVFPRMQNAEIDGELAEINHYIGEVYFLRAYEYFKRYKEIGDFPIIDQVMPDDKVTLIQASIRQPRNEVARFILDDLNKAIELMGDKEMPKTRISKDAALLLKSRIALFEASWLKYFKNTPFVPQGPDWPGKSKEYSKDYVYPTGNIDSEINYFFDVAMDASKEVADKYIDQLTPNNGKIQQSVSDPENLYMDMFGTIDLTNYPEVLLWRQYARGLVHHSVVYFAQRSNAGIGVTKGMVDAFLMTNGLPIYAPGSGFQGDDIEIIDNKTYKYKNRIDRDTRLSLFLKEPGQKNVVFEDMSGTPISVEPLPNIRGTANYVTGYALRKGNSLYQGQSNQGGCYTAAPLFRAAEALLNYMEASYERNGIIDSDASKYWKALRTRAGVDPDFDTTIAATDMQIEKLGDWGAFSAGQLIDATLYNIRRERRCEFMSEGLRTLDLYRWRSLDQLKDDPFIPKGFKIYNSGLIGGGYNYIPANAVSVQSDGDYFCIYRKAGVLDGRDGLIWHMAHYLSPIGINEMILTSNDGTPENSFIYQNPYWLSEIGTLAQE